MQLLLRNCYYFATLRQQRLVSLRAITVHIFKFNLFLFFSGLTLISNHFSGSDRHQACVFGLGPGLSLYLLAIGGQKFVNR